MLPRYVIYVAVVLLGISVCWASKRHRADSTRIGRSGKLRLVKDASELRFMPLRVEFEKDKQGVTSPSTSGGKGDGKVTLQLSASKETTKKKTTSSSPSTATTAKPSINLPTLTQLIQTILQLSQIQDSLRPAATLTTSTSSSPPSSSTSDSAPASPPPPPPPPAVAPSTTTTTTTTTTTISPVFMCALMPTLPMCGRSGSFQQPQHTFFENVGAAGGSRNPYMVFVVPKMGRDAQARYDKEHNFARPRKLGKFIGKQKHRFWKEK